jgi:hypothetical protein
VAVELEHDPKKPVLGLDPGMETGFPKRSCSNAIFSEATMSVYAVNKLCRDALHDVAFREAVKRDPAAAIAARDLTAEERNALLTGDVARLYEMGCHPFLLAYLARWDLFGITGALYNKRIHALPDARQ